METRYDQKRSNFRFLAEEREGSRYVRLAFRGANPLPRKNRYGIKSVSSIQGIAAR